MKTDLHRETGLLQERMDKDPRCRSFSWKVLRQAKLAVGATTYIIPGDTALTAPPFFDNAVRGDSIMWGAKVPGPRVINWAGLSGEDQDAMLPMLRNTSDWILFALAGRTKPGTTSLLLEGFINPMTTKGTAFRKRQWWLSGDDELAEYDKKVEVWISSQHKISRNLLDDLESLVNSRSAKDIPYCGSEVVEGKYWTGTEAGLMRITFFPGLIYATNGSLDKGNMRAGFYRHEGETGGFCKVGRNEEGSSSNRAEYAAACITLEDAIRYAGSVRPFLLLTDSQCLLIAIQKWIGEGIDPTMKDSPGGDILREILELLRNRIELGLFTLFIKIKAYKGEFFNEMADR